MSLLLPPRQSRGASLEADELISGRPQVTRFHNVDDMTIPT